MFESKKPLIEAVAEADARYEFVIPLVCLRSIQFQRYPKDSCYDHNQDEKCSGTMACVLHLCTASSLDARSARK